MRVLVAEKFIGLPSVKEEAGEEPTAKAKRAAAKKKAGRGAEEKHLDEVVVAAEARAAKIAAFLERKLGAGDGAAAPNADQLASLLDITAVDVDSYKYYIEKLPKEDNLRSDYAKDDVGVIFFSHLARQWLC